jgi:hypothetical protein
MGFRFQRRVALFPGVRLNLSASGISVTIGPPGANIHLGQSGTAVNLGIPGTGLSFRHRFAPPGSQAPLASPSAPWVPRPSDGPSPTHSVQPLPALSPVSTSGTVIESAPLAEVTSQSLEGLKQLVLSVARERAELGAAIPRARNELLAAELRLIDARRWFRRVFQRGKIPEREAAVRACTAALNDLEVRRDGAFVDAEFMLADAARAAFNALAEAFEQVAASSRIWDITTEEFTDRRATRSAAGRELDRVVVRFAISRDPILQTESKVLVLANANGPAMFLYPGFLLMLTDRQIALVDLREVKLRYEPVRFVEAEALPPDAVVVDYTWAWCNKDGTRDRRFANNYQVPVVRYGRITIRSATGVNEEYQISRDEAAQRFVALFVEYQAKLPALDRQT